MAKHHAFTEPHGDFCPWQADLDALADRYYSLTGPLMTSDEYVARASAINGKWRGLEDQAASVGEG